MLCILSWHDPSCWLHSSVQQMHSAPQRIHPPYSMRSIQSDHRLSVLQLPQHQRRIPYVQVPLRLHNKPFPEVLSEFRSCRFHLHIPSEFLQTDEFLLIHYPSSAQRFRWSSHSLQFPALLQSQLLHLPHPIQEVPPVQESVPDPGSY